MQTEPALDENSLCEARRKAQSFIEDEQQFHLGALPTEQSNPKTRGLAEIAQRDTAAAIRMLQAVDADILPKVDQAFAGQEFARLVAAMQRAIIGNQRICFSGCGATGRLSILLESAWRGFCRELREKHPDVASRLPNFQDRVTSIMTGGDFALIRSVENFEDHQEFGRQQVREANFGKGDVMVAITEGGETSSVIGTVWQARENGAEVFFVFNNPADLLARHVERSRKVIEDAGITKLDLSCGPMALAGSTRMQATTSELLVVGAALESALAQSLRGKLSNEELANLGLAADRPASDYVRQYTALLDELGSSEAVEAMATMVQFEAELYRRNGLVTYMADRCLLDIFTDTTERSPTFMLPKFRQHTDAVSPPPWAFVKDPMRRTPEAWDAILHRPPRCLAWDAELYGRMNAPGKLIAAPPRLSAAEMFEFKIGSEPDASRYAAAENAVILVVGGAEISRLAAANDHLRVAFELAAKPFRQCAILAIGPAPSSDLAGTCWHVPVRPSATALRLFDRLRLKLVLNTVSTATMARLGRVSSNWMIYVEPTNKKLIDRATRLVAELSGVDYNTACYALFKTIEELSQTVLPGQERPSPVVMAIARLKAAVSR